MKTSHIIKKLREDSEYQEFFKKALKKFDISSPADLKDPERKKHFFNYVDKNYSAKSEGTIKEAYFPVAGTDSQELKKTKQMLANWFNNMKGRVVKQQLDVLNDLIEDYAYEYAQDWASGNMDMR